MNNHKISHNFQDNKQNIPFSLYSYGDLKKNIFNSYFTSDIIKTI